MTVHSPVVHRFSPGATVAAPPPPAPSGVDELLVGPPAAADDLTDATAIFVDFDAGDDGNAGTRAAPKKTIASGKAALGAKDNLALKAGVYHRLTASVAIGSEMNGKTIRSYGAHAATNNKAIVTGGKALTGWQAHPTLADCYYSTTHLPLNPASFIVSIDGKRYPFATKFFSYNDYAGQIWADGWKDARQGVIGLIRDDPTGASATVGRFDGRNGELPTAADIDVGGLGQDQVSLICRRDFGTGNPRTNGYSLVKWAIDASVYDPVTGKFTFAGSLPDWFTWDSGLWAREKFENKGAHGILVGNPDFLAHAANPDGAYAHDPRIGGGAVVVKWSAGQADLAARAVEIGALNDTLFEVASSTVSFRDVVLEGTEMHGYTIKDGSDNWRNDFAGTTTRKVNAGIECTGTNGATGSITGCAARNMPQGISIDGSQARKDVTNTLFRDNEFSDFSIGSSTENQIFEHNEVAWGYTFNRMNMGVRCGTSHINFKVRHNYFHSRPGPAVLGNCSNSSGYEFFGNVCEETGRFGHDMGTHYLVKHRTNAGAPAAGYSARVHRNLFKHCIGEAEFHHVTGPPVEVLPISRWGGDTVGGPYMDNGAEYWQVEENMFIGHSKSAVSLNAFDSPVQNCTVKHNVMVCLAPDGESDPEAYDSLRIIQGWTPETGTITADVDVTNNLFVLQNADKTGDDFLQGAVSNGTHRDNAVHQIDQPDTWSGELVIANQADIWDVPGTPGAVKASCPAFGSPVNLWPGFQPGGAFWTETDQAGFQ